MRRGLLLLIPLVTPEIVAGVSAFVLFAQLGVALSVKTIILAHITFSISYVCVVVRGRLAAMGTEIEEAALDLGATPLQAVRLVTLPALWPAILAAAMLVFVLSFDDFVLSFFTTGEDAAAAAGADLLRAALRHLAHHQRHRHAHARRVGGCSSHSPSCSRACSDGARADWRS